MLTNADLSFGKIKDENNHEVELTEGNYSSFIKSKDRRVREEAFKLLFGTYKQFENTLATSLTSSLKNIHLLCQNEKIYFFVRSVIKT